MEPWMTIPVDEAALLVIRRYDRSDLERIVNAFKLPLAKVMEDPKDPPRQPQASSPVCTT